jgi:TPR repeat protein/tRNA A-37 threonylcarbamoyl transferase component Bud32
MSVKKRHLNALKTGQKLHWYEIRDILGQGGFGITYLAQDLNLGHEVAVKEYLPVDLSIRTKSGTVSPVSDEHHERYYWGLERFLEEARTLGQFKHPNIVQVRNVFEANNTAYMVMEYELGETFQDILNRRKTISEIDLKTIIFPIVDGMKVVHAAGFIHRDIKPANIFLRVDGDPVLLDFGSARTSLEQADQSLTSIFSRGYAPIEQHSSEETQGAWTDIYALGATMYRSISGIPPTDAVDRSAGIAQIDHDTYVSITEIASADYSEDFLKAVDYALQFRQQDRPQSMSEWIATFDRRDISHRNQFNADNSLLEEQISAAESGDVSAQSKLAFMYAKGVNAEIDERTAVRWYREAAENNHLNAQYNLAIMYAKGRGVEQDYNEALKWYERAAEQGDESSQYTLGMMYSKGVGTEKDNERAFKWFMKAAEHENTNAEYKVGEMLSKAIGVGEDLTAAHGWYEKASMKGHTLAQMKMAYMYGKGHGVKRNDTEAFHWFRKAAEQGHPKAQYNLGVIYAKGRGITKDLDEAKKWYERAVAQGDEHAEKALSKIAN